MSDVRCQLKNGLYAFPHVYYKNNFIIYNIYNILYIIKI